MKIHVITNRPESCDWEKWYLEKKHHEVSIGPPVSSDARLPSADVLLFIDYCDREIGQIVSKASRPFVIAFTERQSLSERFLSWMEKVEKDGIPFFLCARDGLEEYYSNITRRPVITFPRFFYFVTNSGADKLFTSRVVGWIGLDLKYQPINALFALAHLQHLYPFTLIWTGKREPILNRFTWSRVRHFVISSKLEYMLLPQTLHLTVAIVGEKDDVDVFHASLCLTVGLHDGCIVRVKKDRLSEWVRALSYVFEEQEDFYDHVFFRYWDLYESEKKKEEEWFGRLSQLLNQI